MIVIDELGEIHTGCRDALTLLGCWRNNSWRISSRVFRDFIEEETWYIRDYQSYLSVSLDHALWNE